MNIKKLGLSFALASAAVLGTGAAQAVCNINGTLFQIASEGTTTFAWVRPDGVTDHYNLFTTTNPVFANMINTGLQKHVNISGTINNSSFITCPTSGVSRSSGVVNLLFVQ